MAPRILIVGGGIAGVETALTMALGMPDAHITLVSERRECDVVPNLVFVPFGVEPDDIRIALDELDAFGVDVHLGHVDRIDVDARAVHLSDGSVLEADAIIVAAGTRGAPVEGLKLRTTEHALELRRRLAALEHTWIDGAIVVRIVGRNPWTPPAYEFALLLDSWLRSVAQRETIAVRIRTYEPRPCSPLSRETGEFVQEQLRSRDIPIRFGVADDARIDDDVDLHIDFGPVAAIELPGLPPIGDDGFYAVDEHGALADGVYLVGDAANLVLKAAFATSWQARRVLAHLGGNPSLLGESIDRVPVELFEYHMDLGFDTLVVRNVAAFIPNGIDEASPPTLRVLHDATDKLVGTLVRERLLTGSQHTAPSSLVRRSSTMRAGARIMEGSSRHDADSRRPPWERRHN